MPKALLAIEDPAAQHELFTQITTNNLTVRHVEQASRDHKKGKSPEHLRTAGYDNRQPKSAPSKKNCSVFSPAKSKFIRMEPLPKKGG